MHRKPVDGHSSDDLFRSRLDQMINMSSSARFMPSEVAQQFPVV